MNEVGRLLAKQGLLMVGGALFIALLSALACWLVGFRSVRLWNRTYRASLGFHVIWGLGAAVTFAGVLLLFSLRYAEVAAKMALSAWEQRTTEALQWQHTAIDEAYEAVHELGLEDFDGVPTPSENGFYIPISAEASRAVAANVLAKHAARQFEEHEPLLARYLESWAGDSAAALDTLIAQRFAELRAETLPGVAVQVGTAQAVAMATQVVRERLAEQVPAYTRRVRWITVSVLLLTQTIAIGVPGYLAYRSIRVHI
ncbi:MAG: hypothetical protein AAGG50_06215 [Bacteroidota bacterium]